MAVAEKFLVKHRRGYRKFVESEEESARLKEYERQGKIIADAIGPQLSAAITTHAISAGAPPSQPGGAGAVPPAGADASAGAPAINFPPAPPSVA